MNFFKKLVYKSMFIPGINYLYKFIFRYISKPYKSVIFVASTGRSGTGTLYEIFNVIDNTVAFHEPRPLMHAKLMSEKNMGKDKLAKKIFYNVKLNMILMENVLKNNKYYMEANHMFIKSYYEYVYSVFGDRLKIIHLYRDPILVAKSMYELNTIPGKNKLGNKWYLDYKAKNNVLKISHLLENELNHDYYKCLWYCYEIEYRVKFLKKNYNNIQTLDIDVADLNNIEKIKDLLQTLDIEYKEETLEEVVGIKHNKKSESKINLIDLSECEKMNKLFCSLVIT